MTLGQAAQLFQSTNRNCKVEVSAAECASALELIHELSATLRGALLAFDLQGDAEACSILNAQGRKLLAQIDAH